MIKKLEKPLLVTEPSLPRYEDYIDTIKKIWSTKWLTNQGVFHNDLECKIKNFLKVDYLTLFCNGHSALDCAIKQLRFTKEKWPKIGGEIITTPFTFVSTTHAISMNGFTPIFCDIKADDYTIDEDKIEGLITDKTVAIVCTHVYGFPCNVERISQLAKKHDLKVIYDAAHAFGVEVNGVPIGNFGDMSMFSFHATKVYNTIEGGALAYSNVALQNKLNLMRNFGILDTEEIASFGINAKMNEFQAAMGIENLKYVTKNIQNRKNAAQIYYKELSRIPGIKLVDLKQNIKYNYSYMPILIDEKCFGISRDQLYDKLTQYNIYPRKYFYPLISNTPIYKHPNTQNNIADYVAKSILCLPLFADIQKEDVEYVCKIINDISRNT